MQALLAERISIAHARAGEQPVIGIDYLIGGSGHDAGIGEDHAEQVCFRFVVDVKSAF